MDWLGRLFEKRGALARTLLLNLSGIGYLVFSSHDHRAVSGAQWALAVVAFIAALLLHKRPLLNLGVQAGLLIAALVLLDDPTINQVGAAWALLEITIWGPPTLRWWGAGLLSAIYLSRTVGEPITTLPARLYGLVLAVGVPLLLGTVIRFNTQLSQQAELRATEAANRREMEARAARATERGAIARELHDVVAHHVASMVLRVGVARHVLPDVDPRVREVFDDVHATGTTALEELRNVVAVLRDPAADQGDASLTAIEPSALPAALDGAVERARGAGLIVDADIDESVGSLDAVRGLAVLRLTQEALTNVAKHAGAATRVRLTVAVTDGDVTWEVVDDGRGSAPSVPPGGGHGLTGMRERVSLLGGHLEAGPDGGGWRVRTLLPRVTA